MRRLLAVLLPLGVCFQIGSCGYVAGNRGFFGGGANTGGGNAGFGALGRLPALPGYGQPFAQLGPILQPGGAFAGAGGPP